MIVVLVIAIGLFLYYRNRESTDDAQVDGHITPIAAKISGRVQEVLVHDNEPVKAGQVLVKIDPRDYQAALDNAKASLALAESEAAVGQGGRSTHAGKRSERNVQCERGIARARKRIWRERKPHMPKRKIRTWRLRRPTWRRAARMRNWRKRTWSATGR